MRPRGVAELHAAGVLQRRPEVAGVLEPSGPQVQPDQAHEGLLGGTTGAPATDRLAERPRLGEVGERGLLGDQVDPALDEGQRGLEPAQGGLLLGRRGGREEFVLQGFLDRGGVLDVHRAHLLLDGVGVDGDVAGVVAHGGLELRPEPRHLGEEPGPGGLADGEVEPHLRLLDPEPLGEGADVRRQEGDVLGAQQRQADLGAGQQVAGERADAVAELGGEHRASQLLHRRPQLADQATEVEALHLRKAPLAAEPLAAELAHLVLERVCDGGRDTRGDRLDEVVPHRHRRLDPLGPAPGEAGPRRRVEGRHGVDPQLGDLDGLGDLALLPGADRRVGVATGDGLAGDVGRHRGPGLGRLRREHLGDLALQHGELTGVGRVDAHALEDLGHRVA